MPLENIKTVNVGGFGARLSALLNGEVEAASLLLPQIDMADQLGLRRIIANDFHTLWWVPENASKEGVEGYLRALDRAEHALESDLPNYLPLWRKTIPDELVERFVDEPVLQSEFDEVMEQVKRWGLDDFLRSVRSKN